MQYNDVVCQSLRQARIFSDSEGHSQTSIDITPDGTQLVATSEDEALRLYDCFEEGELKKTLYSKKYGVGIVRFMHEPSTEVRCGSSLEELTVVCASSCDWDHSIRYWSMHDNRYLRYLKGHRAKVVGLEVAPNADLVLSASVDATIRLWDVRSDACAGLLKLQDRSLRPCVAFDDRGLVFAALVDGGNICMFDMRQFDAGPFTTFRDFQDYDTTHFQSLKFSSDGNLLLLSGGSDKVLVIGAYQGIVLQVCQPSQPGQIINDACLTPDTNFVFGGTQDGSLLSWPLQALPEEMGQTGCVDKRWQDSTYHAPVVSQEIAVHLGTHAGPVHCVACSPRTMMVATACRNVNLWVPDMNLKR